MAVTSDIKHVFYIEHVFFMLAVSAVKVLLLGLPVTVCLCCSATYFWTTLDKLQKYSKHS